MSEQSEPFDPVEAAEEVGIDLSEVPVWDDEYLDRVSDRLMFNYDLERDRAVDDERFALYAEMRMESQKHFFHPALDYANHEHREFLFARRRDRPTVADLERLIQLGHDLADSAEWLVPDEEHFGTDFTFVLVAEEIPADVAEFVEGFRDRNLLKFGYYGHYEVNVAVVAPEREAIVKSESADSAEAFALWRDVPPAERRSVFGRLREAVARRLGGR
ncbi:hypothetical protein [Halobellus rubicundus]|uniref:DUF8052 domain-containing protein n=1 Tax=Halobellus rubicundus TaxID=2996466 RepID=A0ABD5M7D0_9EURY